MKYISIFISTIFINIGSFSQSIKRDKNEIKNAIIVEGLGHSRALIALNYERIFYIEKEFIFYGIRTGIGYTPGINIRNERLKSSKYIPLLLSLNAGKKHNYAQLGIGYNAAFGHDFIDSTTTPASVYKKFESAFIISLGYRYMNNGTIFQIYPLLQWRNNPSSKFAVGFGLSIGGRF